jgi:hypothetical protein
MTEEGEPGPTPAVASEHNAESHESDAGDTAGASERDRLTRLLITLGKVLGIAVTLVTLIGGTVTLLFRLHPSWEPCIGGGGAAFTSVQVIPRYPLAQYIRDINHENLPEHLPHLTGAEIRYSYSTSNLSGTGVRLYESLQEIMPNGDITAPPGPPPNTTSSDNLQAQEGVPGQPPPAVTPNKCSQDSSGLDWIQLKHTHHRHRYRVVLELYKGAKNNFTERVGVGRTPTFDY